MNTRTQLLNAFLKTKSLSTDTRSIPQDALFFALKGHNFNGNVYGATALENGASLVIIDEAQEYLPADRFVLVEDVLQSLQDLASDYRELLSAKVIGLTGSNGKTTCKELFRDVLATSYITYATKGNLNNHIGVPISLLSIPMDAEIAIIEMGANHQGEIALLTNICRPDIGYITNFGKAHLEGFGGVEGVIKGKSELYNWLRINKKKVIVNAADPLQVEKSEGIDRFLFGDASISDLKIHDLKSEQAAAELENQTIQSHLTGSFHFTNIAAAIALGKLLDIDIKEIKAAIENYNPQMNRSEWRKTERNEILMDAYNANPDSMLATIETFAKLAKPNKWFVLGDMFELGNYSAEEHQLAVERLKTLEAEHVILVGEAFHETNHPNYFFSFKTTAEANVYLKGQALKDSTILLKGSRGMKLESLVEVL